MSEKKQRKRDFLDEQGIAQEYGIGVKAGQQLETRLGEADRLRTIAQKELDGTTALEQIKSLEEKIWEFDGVMRTTVLPYLMAANNPKYQRAAGGYESLRRWAIWDCKTARQEMELEDPVVQSVIATDLERWLDLVFFEQALFLYDNSFGKDVELSHDKILVFKTQPQISGAQPRYLPPKPLGEET